MPLTDKQIRNLCINPYVDHGGDKGMFLNQLTDYEREHRDALAKLWAPMIEPFTDGQVRKETRLVDLSRANDGSWKPCSGVDGHEEKRVISYGLSSHGYDVRIADEFKIFTNINSTRIDPKNFDDKNFSDFKGPVCIIPPNSFVLARSVEWFRMPANMLAIVLAKSTYARCGVDCLATPLEAEWEGHITLEYANTTPLPALLYANEGAAQVVFFESSERPEVTYKDRGGKYQGQSGITLPKA
jgi:dCTP deaminase